MGFFSGKNHSAGYARDRMKLLLVSERIARVAAKEEKERLAEEKRELERVQAAKKAQEEEKAKVEEAKRKLAAKAEKRKNKK